MPSLLPPLTSPLVPLTSQLYSAKQQLYKVIVKSGSWHLATTQQSQRQVWPPLTPFKLVPQHHNPSQCPSRYRSPRPALSPLPASHGGNTHTRWQIPFAVSVAYQQLLQKVLWLPTAHWGTACLHPLPVSPRAEPMHITFSNNIKYFLVTSICFQGSKPLNSLHHL